MKPGVSGSELQTCPKQRHVQPGDSRPSAADGGSASRTSSRRTKVLCQFTLMCRDETVLQRPGAIPSEPSRRTSEPALQQRAQREPSPTSKSSFTSQPIRLGVLLHLHPVGPGRPPPRFGCFFCSVDPLASPRRVLPQSLRRPDHWTRDPQQLGTAQLCSSPNSHRLSPLNHWSLVLFFFYR